MLLIVAVWHYRNNRPIFFVLVGSIFAAAAAILVSSADLSDRLVQSLALGWLLCMLVAAASGIVELAQYIKNKKNRAAEHNGREHKV